MATFFPLQGFWNAIIYFRPRYQKNRERKRAVLPQSYDIKVSENISNGDGPDTDGDLPSHVESDHSSEIWKRVKLRQSQRAQAAVEKAEKDKMKQLEDEKEQQTRTMHDPDLSRQEENDNIEVLDSGGIERRDADVVDPFTHSPGLRRHSQRGEQRKSFWKTIEVGSNSEILKRVKLRQLERAQAAVKMAEEDEKKRLEEEKEKEHQRLTMIDPDRSMQEAETSSVDLMSSGEIERRVMDIIHPMPDSPLPGHSGHSQRADPRKSFWKTVIPL